MTNPLANEKVSNNRVKDTHTDTCTTRLKQNSKYVDDPRGKEKPSDTLEKVFSDRIFFHFDIVLEVLKNRAWYLVDCCVIL